MAGLPKYKANIMWWNSSSMYIRCPHCDRIHRHGFDGKYQIKHRRAPHCESNESYTICFPSNGLYEIDRSRGLYVRAGADPSVYFAQFNPAQKVDVSDRRKWTEAKEEVELDDYHRDRLQRISLAFGLGPIREVERGNRLQITVADMIMGRLQAVRSYLETSPEKDIFLHGVKACSPCQPNIDERNASQNINKDDQDGNHKPTQVEMKKTTTSGETTLHMAACEMYPEVVELLLEFGANPNMKTVDGRTPLMEAAIWGRLNNVKYLLSHGADKSIRCMREGKSLHAIDFAEDTRENSEERYDRSGGKDQVYKEVTHERNKERMAIVQELSDEVEDAGFWKEASSSNINGFALTTLRNGRSIISLLANFDVPNRQKTIGILFRGDIINDFAFPPVAAMSGWKHQSDLDLNVQIEGRTWTDEVFRLCQIIGHHLPADGYDQGRPGQFHACHAEKQLTAYFVSKHIFLSPEVAVDDLGMSGLCLDGSQSDCESQDMLAELRKAQPPERLQKAVVLASRAICNDCNDFVKKVNMALGLRIEFRGAKQYA